MMPDSPSLLAELLCNDARARALLDAVPLPRLLHMGVDELRAAGLDEREAARLRAALELGRRAVDAPLERGAPIRNARDVADRLRGRLLPLEHEELHVLGLDGANRLVVHAVAAAGAVNQVYASARDVFRPLLREAAVGAILVHNHPSGLPAPSEADLELTVKLAEAGALLGLQLLDHVVLARGGVYSFAENGLLVRAG
jgi:DNA repair protein RadC